MEATAPARTIDLREDVRKSVNCYIAYSVNGVVYFPGYGLEISKGGMLIMTEVVMPSEDFYVRIMLKERDFVVTVKKVWQKETTHCDKTWWVSGLQFRVLGAKDREFIKSFVRGEQYLETSRLVEDLAALRAQPDDVARLLPQEVLDRFLRHLVALKRLAPAGHHTPPLVKYHYDGSQDAGSGMLHFLTITSKVLKDGSCRKYRTRFRFDGDFKTIEVL